MSDAPSHGYIITSHTVYHPNMHKDQSSILNAGTVINRNGIVSRTIFFQTGSSAPQYDKAFFRVL